LLRYYYTPLSINDGSPALPGWEEIQVTWITRGRVTRQRVQSVATSVGASLEDADRRDLALLNLVLSPTLAIGRVRAAALATTKRGDKTVAYPEPRREQTAAFIRLRERAEKAAALRGIIEFAAQIPGYDTFHQQYKITDGRISLDKSCLTLWLQSNTTRLVDSLRWIIPLQDGIATQTLDTLALLHAAAEKHVAQFPWIQDWKNATRDRKIEIGFMGTAPDAPADYTVTHWQRATLPGSPKYRLHLSCETHRIWLWIGDTAHAALITETQIFGDQEHWLDSVDTFYDSQFVVSREGSLRRVPLPNPQ
jgi:hypothetical protein